MKILIAPDKFKGSLTAPQVAAHLAAGLRSSFPGVEVTPLPVADGGDGTVDAVVEAGFTRHTATVRGPTGTSVTASYAMQGDVAVVELAEASGLRRLPGGVLAPLTATSFGTGELIGAAVDGGARRIVLGLGGSACTDGGVGMLAALGVRFLDAEGRPITPRPDALPSLAAIDDAALRRVDVEIASDVDNPLLGPHGAASVYGPQKGASPDEVERLDSWLAHLADVVARGHHSDLRDVKGAGAAGGVGYGAMVFLGAGFRPGIDLILDLIGLRDLLAGADLVITGEGSLDEQTLHGKAPVGVARAAADAGVPVVAVAGQRTLSDAQLRAAGMAKAYALTDIEPDPARCMAHAGPLLERLAKETLAGDLAKGTGR